MKVIEYIKQNGTQALTDNFAISVKSVDDLLVLNYSQIDSPKTHPLVVECRSLILESDTLNVVSRSFDRFFNYGEGGKMWERDQVSIDTKGLIDWNKAVAFEKIDGSLIKIYHHKGRWNISTKGTAYGESDCMGYGITFQELVWKAIGVSNDEEFQYKMKDCIFCTDKTYIFEVTSVENRVVKRYEGYKLYFLAARYNSTGEYVSEMEKLWFENDQDVDFIHYPKAYKFNSPEECLSTARELKDLDEGYVIYQDGVPVCKIKSPAYVAIHHIRGEGLNPKRMKELVISGEVDEYLTYFPEDETILFPYIEALRLLDIHMDCVYDALKDVEDQKEFALKAQAFPFKAAMFTARLQNISVIEAFNQQNLAYRVRTLEDYLK